VHIAELFKSIRVMVTFSLVVVFAPVPAFGADLKTETMIGSEHLHPQRDAR
jgi:hypothetical protein